MTAAHQYLQTIEQQQDFNIACPEEVAYGQKWIDAAQMEKLAAPMLKNGYD